MIIKICRFLIVTVICYCFQAKPDAGKLVLATVALLVASTSSILIVCIISNDSSLSVKFKILFYVYINQPRSLYTPLSQLFNENGNVFLLLQPKFGGKIIDIVSGDISTPEDKAEALEAVKSTILSIFMIVVVG